MNQKKKIKNPVAFMGIGVFVFVIGVFLIFGIKTAITNILDSQKLKEYSQTTGIVVRSIEEERTHSGSAGKHGTSHYTVYISVISYTVNGRSYELNGPAYTNRERIGTQKVVFYNPKNPEDSLMEEHVSDTWYMLFIMAIPMVLTGGVFLFVFKVVFSKGKKSEGIYEESLLEKIPEGKTCIRMIDGGGFAFAERTLLFQKAGEAICYVYSTNDPRISDQRCYHGRDFYVDTALLERAEAEAPMIVYENRNAYDLRPLEIPASEFENVAVYALKKMIR